METEWSTPERVETRVSVLARPADTRRPMKLIHLMALVGAVALSIVLVPKLAKTIKDIDPSTWWNGSTYVFNVTTITLVVWTPVSTVSALIDGRRQPGWAARSYGTAAVFAASVALVLLATRKAVEAIPFVGGSQGKLMPSIQTFLWQSSPTVTATVTAVWLVLAWTGAGRRPAGWLEYLGLVLAAAWVVWCYAGPLLSLSNFSFLNERIVF